VCSSCVPDEYIIAQVMVLGQEEISKRAKSILRPFSDP